MLAKLVIVLVLFVCLAMAGGRNVEWFVYCLRQLTL